MGCDIEHLHKYYACVASLLVAMAQLVKAHALLRDNINKPMLLPIDLVCLKICHVRVDYYLSDICPY